MGSTFTRMDESTAEQWAVIGAETAKNQVRVAESVLDLLRSLSSITDGFGTDQLTHCLQTATLAEQSGADDQVVVAALCHTCDRKFST
jgi:predicted HD phosphohydrolase